MASVVAALIGQSAVALPPLRDVKEIDDGLFTVGLANEIRRNCPTIKARVIYAYGVLRNLKREARSLGYTNAQIDAHVNSDAEKDRLRARGEAYMEERGFAQTEAGFCALGRAEIAAGSEVGALLRETN
ncbi:MAG: DUF5333 domain-containing protein [Pseudomonadota bacterium]